VSGLPPDAAIHRGDGGLTPDDVLRQILGQVSGWGAANYTALLRLGGQDVEGHPPPRIWTVATPDEQAPEPPAPTTARERSLDRMRRFSG
jgi:hypothetical protein